ncbi:MAG TPA: IS4 family transposase [Salinimicrobium sp.]|nr:IS4 family transposase [Salinimicrobium sp.]
MANYEGITNDKRLDARAQQLWDSLCAQPSSTISRLSSNRAEQVAYYRLLENEKLTEQSLINELTNRVGPLAAGRDLLCVEDTSEINVSKNKNRLRAGSGLGRSDNIDNATCFKIHPGLVLDATDYNPLGFSAVKVFHRDAQKPDRFLRKYKSQPIQEKESYKWIEVSQDSKSTLAKANSVTFIQDREGDIFEQFALVPDDRHHLLIRSRTTRKQWDGPDLYLAMQQLPVADVCPLEVDADKRINRQRRTAQMAIRYGEFRIKRPASLKKPGYPDYVTVRGVWAQEITEGIDEKELVNWKLLTTHTIDNAKEALKIVEWYGARWYIEQVFRLLKHQGFGIEDAQLETGWAIRKLLLMQLSSLLKVLQMRIAYNSPEGGQPIEEVFDEQEIEVLTHLNKTLQGNTSKTQNQNNPKKTKWAAWIVGRLGGWKGYGSLGPPGVICLKRGFDRFNNILEGINIAKDMCTG